jgi:hypothetical protein
MSEINPELNLTLDDAVREVLANLTGLDLQYDPRYDRYNAVARQLNRAMRACALEKEWSYFSDVTVVGQSSTDQQVVQLTNVQRPRVVNDDAVRLCRPDTGIPVQWAYFLPRDALHKYRSRDGLWCSVTRTKITFSRPLFSSEDGLDIELPIMREPTMFDLPEQPEDPTQPLTEFPAELREQPIDFPYPDLVILRAAYYYAQTDPVMQPRVQTLEAQYKDLMYQLLERDDRMTDSPFLNDFQVPIANSVNSTSEGGWWRSHPHSDERR